MPEEGPRRGEGDGGTNEAVSGLAYPVDSYVIDAPLVEGSVGLGRDFHDVQSEVSRF